MYKRVLRRRPIEADYWAGSSREGFADFEYFLDRLPLKGGFEGRRILDVGCGTGTFVIHLARLGAERVVGIDIDPNYIRAAQERVADEFPELSDRVSFVHAATPDVLDETFDLVISKEVFEHLSDPEGVVAAMVRRLEPGGEFATGFGPFWRAAYGGHLDSPVPWLHLLVPTRAVAAEFNEVRPGRHVTTWQEMGIGQLTFRRFQKIMQASELEPVDVRINASTHPAVRAMTVLRRVPGLEELMTTNVFGVWRKPA